MAFKHFKHEKSEKTTVCSHALKLLAQNGHRKDTDHEEKEVNKESHILYVCDATSLSGVFSFHVFQQ